MTSFNQSEYFISAQHSYSTLNNVNEISNLYTWTDL